MGLESGSFIATLVATNPVGATDPKSQGDDHIRLIKKALQNSFPRISTTVEATPAELNFVVGASQGLVTLSASLASLITLVGQMGTFSASVTSSDITGSIRAPVLKTQAGFTAGTFTAATVVVNDKGIVTEISSGANTGKIVQIVNTQTGAVSTGTTIIPNDDTIPQNTEGDEYMTLAVTPTSATNILQIDVVVFGCEATSDPSLMIVALFQDTTAGAIACGSQNLYGIFAGPTCCTFRHRMTAGTTSATTFKVRAGMEQAGTFVFNGGNGTGRKFGGVLASSITITEISV